MRLHPFCPVLFSGGPDARFLPGLSSERTAIRIAAALFVLVMGLTVGLTAVPGRAAEGDANKIPETQVVPLPVPSDPTISFRLWFKTGSQNDPAGKEGLAALTAAMLTEGSTQKHRYEEILDLLFPLAAGYSSNVDLEMTVIDGRVHKDNLDVFYALLMQAIREPAFKQEDLDRLKSRTLNYLENSLRYASDEELGKAVLYTTLFAGTPYGHIPDGQIESVRSITLDDVKTFYKAQYTRANVVIGIGGGYSDRLVQKLRQDLGELPAGSPAAVPVSKPKPVDGIHVIIVEKDAPATAISMGFPIDVIRGQKEWYPLAVASSWLGEHRNSASHLYQVIREARGLNYGDYAYIESFPGGGSRQMPPQNVARRQQIFEIWIRPVPNDARHFALRAALREFKQLSEHGLTPDQAEGTSKFLRKYVLHYAPTTMDRLGYSLDDRFYGIAGGHLQLFRQRMETVKPEEVNAAIRQHLPYGSMQVVMVTSNAQALKEALVSDAPSPIKYSTPKPAAVVEEDAQIASFALGIKPENVKIVRVEDLFK